MFKAQAGVWWMLRQLEKVHLLWLLFSVVVIAGYCWLLLVIWSLAIMIGFL
jgi:hypothetical protein